MLGLALALALAAAPAATAATWTEVGDAGTLPSNAQVAFGDGGLTSISGSLNSTTDRDMFEIYIDGGGTFSATTVAQPGTVFDTQLFLFDSSGMGVYASDDDPSAAGASQFRSTLPASNPLTPVASGYYFLLIDNSPSFPTGAGGVIFPNFATSAAAEFAVVGPTGPGGGSPITGYSGSGTETGTYTIALTGASFIIPEPGTLALLAAGSPVLLALALRRRGRSGRRPSPAATSPRD
jgi:hypothetical protein